MSLLRRDHEYIIEKLYLYYADSVNQHRFLEERLFVLSNDLGEIKSLFYSLNDSITESNVYLMEMHDLVLGNDSSAHAERFVSSFKDYLWSDISVAATVVGGLATIVTIVGLLLSKVRIYSSDLSGKFPVFMNIIIVLILSIPCMYSFVLFFLHKCSSRKCHQSFLLMFPPERILFTGRLPQIIVEMFFYNWGLLSFKIWGHHHIDTQILTLKRNFKDFNVDPSLNVL